VNRQLDPAVRQILDRAKGLIADGDVSAALQLYAAAFDGLVARLDHFNASNVAHMAGVAEPEPSLKHAWNERALREADAVVDRDSVSAFYSSLHNNLGYSHSMLRNEREARYHVREAWRHVDALEPGPYGDRVKAAIRKRLAELGDDPGQ
jgi:hypothetical protein